MSPEKTHAIEGEAPHIMVVDDDDRLRKLLRRYLSENGYRVTTAENAEDAEAKLRGLTFDLLVLDVMMPGENGVDLTRRLRERLPVPILLLTAMSEAEDRISGLESGADDYLTKPFEPRELLARVRSVLRRLAAVATSDVAAPTSANQSYVFEGWCLDIMARTLTDPAGDGVALSSGEFSLLMAFVEHPNRVLSRDQLLDFTHGHDTPAFDRSVDVQIARLRKKIKHDPLAPDFIKTVRNAGYIFAGKVSQA